MEKSSIWLTSIIMLLTLSSPLIPEAVKLFDLNVSEHTVNIGGFDVSDRILLAGRFSIVLLVVFLSAIMQYYGVYKPFKNYEELLVKTFDLQFKPYLEKISRRGIDLRMNVMRGRRLTRTLFLMHRLEPIYHYGFEDNHRDKCIKFYAIKLGKLRWAQGACGLCFVEEKVKFVDLRESIHNFNMWWWQRDRTKHVQGILSIPVFKSINNTSPPKVTGVINIDTSDPEVVDHLKENERDFNEVVEYFEKYASYIALWL